MAKEIEAAELSAEELQEAWAFEEQFIADFMADPRNAPLSFTDLMALYAREKVRKAVAEERERIAERLHVIAGMCSNPTKKRHYKELAERIKEGQ